MMESKITQDTTFVCEPVTINIPSVEEWTITSLKYACKHNKVKGYTKMSREQLVEEVNGILKRAAEEKSHK